MLGPDYFTDYPVLVNHATGFQIRANAEHVPVKRNPHYVVLFYFIPDVTKQARLAYV
jgi:hypothetical protein